jgi:hypothetical protein
MRKPPEVEERCGGEWEVRDREEETFIVEPVEN